MTNADFAVLLENINGVEADMASGLLEAAGIPSMTHGEDLESSVLGTAAHETLPGVALLVPKAEVERARKVLDDAGWNAD